MSKPKLTDWFPANVKPVHVGVYEVESDDLSLGYSFYDGLYFRGIRKTVDETASAIPHVWDHVDLMWRGLAEKP